MDKKRDIKSYFDGVLENIDIMLKNDFYKETDKIILKKIRSKIAKWYKIFKEKQTLIGISPQKLEYMDIEITDFFDKYFKIEPIKENYSERLLYDFGILEKRWKDEMLGEKNE